MAQTRQTTQTIQEDSNLQTEGQRTDPPAKPNPSDNQKDNQWTWNLNDILAPHNFETLCHKWRTLQEEFHQAERQLKKLDANTPTDQIVHTLHHYFQVEEALLQHTSWLFDYLHLRLSSNVQDYQARQQLQALEDEWDQFRATHRFFEEWVRQTPASTLQQLIPRMNRYRPVLAWWKRFQPHLLAQEQERLLTLIQIGKEDDILEAFQTSLEFEFLGKRFTYEELRQFFTSPEHHLREGAYRLALQVFHQYEPMLFGLYSTVVTRYFREQVYLRRHPHAREAHLLEEGVTTQAYFALLETVREHFPLFARYFEKKWQLNQWFQTYSHSRFHIYAPFLGGVTRCYPFEQAWEIVRNAFGEVDERLVQYAENVIQQRHVDVFPRKGKRGGAFCMDIPGKIPYVLLNYQGRVEDIFTLAHELGHAIHDQVIEAPVQTRHPPLTLAEIASTFCELILQYYLLREASEEADHPLQGFLILHMMDDWYKTVARQIAFAWMEEEAHTHLPVGKKDLDALKTFYLQLLREMFGDNMQDLEGFASEWLTIPHLYAVPFYVFSYAWSFLISVVLYQRVRQHPPYINQILRLWRHGGNLPAQTALHELEIYPEKKEFWQEAFQNFQTGIHLLEQYMEQYVSVLTPQQCVSVPADT